jgi:hypothetical protein
MLPYLYAIIFQVVVVYKGGSPEVLVTPGLGGWVSLGPYFFFGHRKNIIFLGVFIHFWHILGTGIGQINALYHVGEC